MLTSKKLLSTVVGLCLLAPVVAWSVENLGHEGQCSHCGRWCACQKVCRMVCEMKDVKKSCYSCKCEDFCVPGPSQKCASHCGCGSCKECREAACVPTVSHIKTKKVLVKHEEVTKKPTYKFLVEYCCPKCAACQACQK
jgi:hypothetical protein